MEILTTITKAKATMFKTSATFELCKTVKRKVKIDSADSRAGKYITDVYSTIVFITVNNKKQYWMTTTDIDAAVRHFKDGAWKAFLPKI
jgi:hypothetical protein